MTKEHSTADNVSVNMTPSQGWSYDLFKGPNRLRLRRVATTLASAAATLVTSMTLSAMPGRQSPLAIEWPEKQAQVETIKYTVEVPGEIAEEIRRGPGEFMGQEHKYAPDYKAVPLSKEQRHIIDGYLATVLEQSKDDESVELYVVGQSSDESFMIDQTDPDANIGLPSEANVRLARDRAGLVANHLTGRIDKLGLDDRAKVVEVNGVEDILDTNEKASLKGIADQYNKSLAELIADHNNGIANYLSQSQKAMLTDLFDEVRGVELSSTLTYTDKPVIGACDVVVATKELTEAKVVSPYIPGGTMDIVPVIVPIFRRRKSPQEDSDQSTAARHEAHMAYYRATGWREREIARKRIVALRTPHEIRRDRALGVSLGAFLVGAVLILPVSSSDYVQAENEPPVTSPCTTVTLEQGGRLRTRESIVAWWLMDAIQGRDPWKGKIGHRSVDTPTVITERHHSYTKYYVDEEGRVIKTAQQAPSTTKYEVAPKIPA